MSTLTRHARAAVTLAALMIPTLVHAQADSLAALRARLDALQGRVDGMTEQAQTTQTDLDKLKRFKFSGYVQVRYAVSEQSADTVKVEKAPAVITPANQDRLFLRRTRFKLTYDANPLSQAVIYLNATSLSGDLNVKLLEAYVTLMDPWTVDHRHQLTIGQMNVPFGYEIERSSSIRELPERSRAENVLFPGERDRGIKLVSAWSPRIETVLGVYNGGGFLDAAVYGTEDPSRSKDVTGRLRFSQGTVDVAVSGYSGTGLVPYTGPEVSFDRTRYGGDAQGYYALPRLGGGSLKGEFYLGTNLNTDSLKTFTQAPTAANPVTLLKPGVDPAHFSTEFRGWYVMWVQNLGEQFQAAARYDEYDPNTTLAHDQYQRWSLGVNYFYDGFVRLTAAYDIPKTDAVVAGGYADPKDNRWTFQVQLKY